MNLISSLAAANGTLQTFNAMGVGYSTKSGTHAHSTIDFLSIKTPRNSQQLTSGSHYYTDTSALHFKTHYYSTTTPVSEVKISINGNCTSLPLLKGTNQNGIYGSTSIPAPANCTPYFYEAKDSTGKIIRFPESGSLLFTISSCNGKSWQEAAASSCFTQGPICTAEQHLNQAGTACEPDSETACGTYDNDCTKLSGWTGGTCTDKQCKPAGCGTGYHTDGNGCAADNLDNCGSKGYKCSEKVAGWNGGNCNNGTCVPSSCKTGYHLYSSTCEQDSQNHCNTHDNDCTKLTGWKDGNCTNKNCVITSCISGYHIYNNTCEADAMSHCGAHGNDCTQLQGWSQGNCTNSQCIASACASGYHIASGICESDSVNSCGASKVNCSTSVEGWLAGKCENDVCVPSKCSDNLHPYNQQCESDSEEHCGSHENNCATSVNFWKSGHCTGGECIVSECTEKKIVSGNQCITKTDPDSGSDHTDSGSDHTDSGTDHTDSGTDHTDSGSTTPTTPDDQTQSGSDDDNYVAAPNSDSCSGQPMSKYPSYLWFLTLFMVCLYPLKRRVSRRDSGASEL